MSIKYEGISTILVPFVDVKVDLNDSGKSTTTIGTDYLGPCICFLFDFMYQKQNLCILDHYTFSQDENDLSTAEVLALLMDYFLEIFAKFDIKIWDNIESSSSSSIITENLSDIKLLVIGGDPKESRRIFNALSSLNANSFEKNINNNEESLYLAKNLINNITILKPVSRMLSEKEERRGKYEKYKNNFNSYQSSENAILQKRI